jgi:hypothetical protein
VNGIQIDQLRERIEETLDGLGMSESPWYCAVEPFSPRLRSDDRGRSPGVRIIWRKSRGILEFFDERGKLLDTVKIGDEQAVAAR